ncbi:MAG: 6-phosphofructokinase [Candidatus Aminicenantes bacterium]|nr:6-phosphofructokinase [Candidatus Aminicenantes bacterium]
MKRIRRLGILTGGGDCPGLNAVIRAVVKTAALRYNAEVVGIRDGFRGLVENDTRPLGFDDVSGILPRGGTILGTSNRHNPFQYPVLDADGNRTGFSDRSADAAATVETEKLDVLVAIGGDGTQTLANELHKQYGIPVVGVPKTIDNDIGGTDLTFGFDTAVAIATEAVDRLHSTAESHHRIMVLEVMGRYAGWIALEAGIAGGGDVILIPEIPFDMNLVARKIRDREKRGKRFSLIVVAEGSRQVDGELVVARKVQDPSDPIRLGGISRFVGDAIEDLTGIESRYTILGHVQRGGSPTAFDRLLATRFGYHAMETAVDGLFGHMVGLQGTKIVATPIAEAVAVPRKVAPDGDIVKTAMALGTSFGF